MAPRSADYSRKTKETEVSVSVDLDGAGSSRVSTGVGFFDHMLEQLSRHSLIDITVDVDGDRHIVATASGPEAIRRLGRRIIDGDDLGGTTPVRSPASRSLGRQIVEVGDTAPLFIVMDTSTRKLPLRTAVVPKVADEPTCQ